MITHILSFVIQILITSASQHEGTGSFEIIGRSGVPAMHAALLPNGHVVFLDKVENYTEIKLNDGRLAYSSLFDPSTKTLTPLRVLTNPFCCGGAFLADGRLLTIGGNGPLTWLDPSVDDGFDALRYLDITHLKDGWTEHRHRLASRRWYASAQTLSDGKIFVAAGSLNGFDPLVFLNNNPTYEILDEQDGTLFLFTARSSQIFDVAKNKVLQHLPISPGTTRTYPNTGGSVMLALSRRRQYEVDIMICGGGESQSLRSPTEPTCGRIQPLSKHPHWTITNMPGGGRGMVEGILLLDNTVVWINGAHRGAEGFGLADDPAQEAMIYNPTDDLWSISAVSSIARLYHSVALMLLDGRILVAGSNPNEMPILERDIDPGDASKGFPTEFRVEFYTPPYLIGKRADERPVIVWMEHDRLKPGDTVFRIQYEVVRDPYEVIVMLYQGGFVTHALHMGQVIVELEIDGWVDKGNKIKETHITVPAIRLAPGPYAVYVLVDGIPGIGRFVNITL